MNSLKEKLIGYMEKNNLTSASLGKKAGISSGIIHNIVKADNPNPTIETVVKIAKTMNYSLDKLLEQSYFEFDQSPSFINPDLLKSVCDYLCELKEIEDKNFNDFCQISHHIYQYCLENNLNQVDSNFAKWYVSKIYKKQ